jgi:type II secretory pathway component PulK
MKRRENRGDAMVTALIVLFAAVVLVASALG